ncbi:flavin reductase family protein [Fuscibacter oryzae]|uniref:Flavin reductase family protein n=1 Tax=Fuscibacter oryzae TaxID=2803939 RepID=A0A8J7MS00_9RHOB|nr:flavin reductase family protein [Fuscibacter oryzae]MBL4929238.1 flavin reductase family protein [Fuscibacter oryzae]
MKDLTPDTFRAAMRAIVGNCAILTVGQGDEANGLVVTSAVSLSAEPPMVLVCINRSSSAHPLLTRYPFFGLSSLGAAQQAVAERFSGRTGAQGPARYDGAEWETAVTGARLLNGAAAAFDCEVEDMIDKATHTIVVGHVRATRITAGVGALTYWHGGYRPVQD